MGLFRIVMRSLRQHALSSTITVGSVGLACGLVMAVFSLSTQTERAFTGGPVGFDAVLGARGSQLQLVLNTVFHLETSPGNIPWKLYRTVAEDPRVKLAIPYAVGDNYRGYRIVGTTPELFTDFEYQKGRKFEIESGGDIFDPTLREAVIGSRVAERTGLKVGSKFNPYHGLYFDPAQRHAEEYIVIGVMKPTNSPSDRVIWIPIEGVFRMEGHVLRGTGEVFDASKVREIPDEHKEVSSVMLELRSPLAGAKLQQLINNQGKEATLAWPVGQVMADLFQRLGWISIVLQMVAYLVVVVAAGSIIASIYNTMNERRREFAILRALGARKSTVFSAIVLEAATIASFGSLLGYAVYAAILGGGAVLIRRETGVVLDVLTLHPVLWVTPLGMIVLGALSGLVPAFKAYSTDVASNLVPAS